MASIAACVLRAVTEVIRERVQELSGQEYVDMYATSMKEKLLTKARRRARELQEAARPGRAVPELEDALERADGNDPWSAEGKDGL